VDARTDVYAFGVVCFEALCGHKPFVGDSILELMSAQVSAERPLLSVIKPELGDHFDEAIRRMMAIDRDDRPASAGAALELLVDAVRAAGFDADSTPVVAEGDRRPPAQTEDAGAAARADSPPASRGQSGRLTTARTVSGEHRRSRAGLLLVAAAVVGGVLAYLLVDPADFGSPATPSPDAGALVQAPASAPAPVRTAAATSTADRTITIVVETSVKGATAYLGDTELGSCPGDFEIDDPGAMPVAITLKAPGYADETVEVVLGDGQVVTIEPQPR
jgi:hypothetical protein